MMSARVRTSSHSTLSGGRPRLFAAIRASTAEDVATSGDMFAFFHSVVSARNCPQSRW